PGCAGVPGVRVRRNDPRPKLPNGAARRADAESACCLGTCAPRWQRRDVQEGVQTPFPAGRPACACALNGRFRHSYASFVLVLVVLPRARAILESSTENTV